MKNLIKVLLGVLIVFSLTACNTEKTDNKETTVSEETNTSETDIDEDSTKEGTVEERATAILNQTIEDIDVNGLGYDFKLLKSLNSFTIDESQELINRPSMGGYHVAKDNNGNIVADVYYESTGTYVHAYLVDDTYSCYETSGETVKVENEPRAVAEGYLYDVCVEITNNYDGLKLFDTDIKYLTNWQDIDLSNYEFTEDDQYYYITEVSIHVYNDVSTEVTHVLRISKSDNAIENYKSFAGESVFAGSQYSVIRVSEEDIELPE